MKTIHLERTTLFTLEMECLRRACFPGVYPASSSEDSFDSRSNHLSARIDGHVAAYGRLTPGPNSVIEAWTSGKAQVPIGEGVIDLCRCVVGVTYRRMGLLCFVCLEGLSTAHELGFRQVVAAVIPGEPFEGMLHELGLKPSGTPVQDIEPSGEIFCVQPLVCEVAIWSRQWLEARQELHEHLTGQGLQVTIAGMEGVKCGMMAEQIAPPNRPCD